MPNNDTDPRQKRKAADTSPHRRSPRASDRRLPTTRRRFSASVSSHDSDSTELEEDIRSREDAHNKRRPSCDEDKQSPTQVHFHRSGGISSTKQAREDRREMLDSWVAPEAAKRPKRIDMEWDTWIAPDLRAGEERYEKETIARLRAKRAEKERKRRSRRTRYDARNMDSWVASNSPSTPEKYEHRERRLSPDISACKDLKQSLPTSKQGNATKTQARKPLAIVHRYGRLPIDENG